MSGHLYEIGKGEAHSSPPKTKRLWVEYPARRKMNKVRLSEILDIAQYEKAREEFRRRVIGLKKNRRLPVGPMVTFVFENHDTVLFQIQEMMRAERIVNDDAIQHELDTYNQLLPGENELAATMLIELPEAARVRDEITKFHGANTGEVTYFQVGDG